MSTKKFSDRFCCNFKLSLWLRLHNGTKERVEVSRRPLNGAFGPHHQPLTAEPKCKRRKGYSRTFTMVFIDISWNHFKLWTYQALLPAQLTLFWWSKLFLDRAEVRNVIFIWVRVTFSSRQILLQTGNCERLCTLVVSFCRPIQVPLPRRDVTLFVLPRSPWHLRAGEGLWEFGTATVVVVSHADGNIDWGFKGKKCTQGVPMGRCSFSVAQSVITCTPSHTWITGTILDYFFHKSLEIWASLYVVLPKG